ncbi:hypothetical protein Csa_011496 [Cucumis sativus]|uniref:Uncharacterized protein n=1 Tax=Cucumis sativus TaxID=3659 RepID=A0A0A0L7A5_CUCSA|nr:hypothetical protein Csa_011496 [Cucumis sativus]
MSVQRSSSGSHERLNNLFFSCFEINQRVGCYRTHFKSRIALFRNSRPDLRTFWIIKCSWSNSRKKKLKQSISSGPTKGFLTELLHYFVYELKMIQFIALYEQEDAPTSQRKWVLVGIFDLGFVIVYCCHCALLATLLFSASKEKIGGDGVGGDGKGERQTQAHVKAAMVLEFHGLVDKLIAFIHLAYYNSTIL